MKIENVFNKLSLFIVKINYQLVINELSIVKHLFSSGEIRNSINDNLINKEDWKEKLSKEISTYEIELIKKIFIFWYKYDNKIIDDNIEISIDNLMEYLYQDLKSFSIILKEYLITITQESYCGRCNDFLLDDEFNEIVSFNYTDTYINYRNLKDGVCQNIHGRLENTIILGIDDKSIVSNYFKKSFQKIEFDLMDWKLKEQKEPELLDIHIFGHSLSQSDDTYFINLFKLSVNNYVTYTIYFKNNKHKQSLINNLINMLSLGKFKELFDNYVIIFKKHEEFYDEKGIT